VIWLNAPSVENTVVLFGFQKMDELQVFAVHPVTGSPIDATCLPLQQTRRILDLKKTWFFWWRYNSGETSESYSWNEAALFVVNCRVSVLW